MPEWNRFSFPVELSHPLQCAGFIPALSATGFYQMGICILSPHLFVAASLQISHMDFTIFGAVLSGPWLVN
jgi:hypothetical protein